MVLIEIKGVHSKHKIVCVLNNYIRQLKYLHQQDKLPLYTPAWPPGVVPNETHQIMSQKPWRQTHSLSEPSGFFCWKRIGSRLQNLPQQYDRPQHLHTQGSS